MSFCWPYLRSLRPALAWPKAPPQRRRRRRPPQLRHRGPGDAFLTINPLAGFPLDPFLVTAQGGGPVAASTLAKDCIGYVPAKPTVTVDYKGKADLLKAFFYSDGDTTLVVQTPDGKYVCGDDTNRLVLDPTVEIKKPAQGRYNVWVGSAAAKDLVPGFLVFTARADMDASKLALGGLVKRPAAPELIPVRDRLVNAAKRVEQAALRSNPPLHSRPAAKPSPRTSPPPASCRRSSCRRATPCAAAW